ncbi:hypothetical protein [Nocardiopsis chromatogenes]|uniref:hypothetical protein n=1 Tax=Nocardiopsis chromatogenes TaxID=280239 RepID=UPI00035E491F|nr:hypothetical protein [Nocardiopsis chromatogenes]
MPRPITFEPRALMALKELPLSERAELTLGLNRLAVADDPYSVADPYMPDASGPMLYHGVLHFGRSRIAVVSLYQEHLRVISIRRNI